MTDIGRYVTLLQRVETDYPNWTTSRLLDSLRRLAQIDTDQFQTLLGTPPADTIQESSPNLSNPEYLELFAMTYHATPPGKPEQGRCFDRSTSRFIGMSHLIAGICGGIHRPIPNIQTQIGPVTIPSGQIIRGVLRLDPLYAVTLTGDLGQTVAEYALESVDYNGNQYGGVGTEATSAELHGDIDGFLIGNWLSTTTAGQNVRTQLVQGNRIRLSQIISEYYRTTTQKTLNMIAGSGYALESNRRFSNFNASLKFITDELYSQTVIFNNWYTLAHSKTRYDPDLSIRAANDFIAWCNKGGGI
jgi:hypothetical protein